jgi:hypothetical protein
VLSNKINERLKCGPSKRYIIKFFRSMIRNMRREKLKMR